MKFANVHINKHSVDVLSILKQNVNRIGNRFSLSSLGYSKTVLNGYNFRKRPFLLSSVIGKLLMRKIYLIEYPLSEFSRSGLKIIEKQSSNYDAE